MISGPPLGNTWIDKDRAVMISGPPLGNTWIDKDRAL